MTLRRTLSAISLALALTVLAACDSSEERAEKYYQSGLEYLQAGDVSRALIEFRNVFKLNGKHKEARRTYAKVERDRGNIREAFSQYLRLVEQFPDDLDGLRALSEIAAQNNDWQSATRYVTRALAISPGDQGLQAIKAVADYGLAIDANSPGDQVKAVQEVRELRAVLPDDLLLRRVIISDLIRAQKNTEALQEIESALLIAPLDRGLYAQRLSLYAALGDDQAVESGLRDMVTRFPDAPEMKAALIRWYVSRKEFDKAEAHLRAQITDDTGNDDAILELVRFLATYRGTDAAVAELGKHITAQDPNPIFRSTRASFLFDLGQRDESIAEMRDILKTAQPSAETRRIKIGLAQMLNITGNVVGARALVEEVLAEDSGDAEALKLKAGWLILGDQAGEAITILRNALDQNPRDPTIMTLMAQAYERDGNRDLLREMLSLAVEASNRAPEESLRYAQLLASEGKFIPAEGVLIDALRIAPGNPSLLVPLGQIYLHVKDWPRATTVADALEKIGSNATRADVINMRAAILAGQKQTDEAIGYPERLTDDGSGDLSTKIAIIRAHLANGDDLAVRPALHLVYGMATKAPNDDNSHLIFLEDAKVEEYITRAQEEEFAVILDIQIGALTPATALSYGLPWLAYDNVHLALDPEFAMAHAGQRWPGDPIGYVTAAQINEAQALMQEYIEENDVAGQRVLLVHQFLDTMIEDKADLDWSYPDIVLTLSADGWGGPWGKISKYNSFTDEQTRFTAFKLFYRWDEPLMTPREALGVDGYGEGAFIEVTPNLVIYQ